MHTCIHAYMHTCIHVYMHTCMHSCAPTHQHTNVPVGMYVCRHTCTCTSLDVHKDTSLSAACTTRHLKLYAKTLHKDTSVQKDISQWASPYWQKKRCLCIIRAPASSCVCPRIHVHHWKYTKTPHSEQVPTGKKTIPLYHSHAYTWAPPGLAHTNR